MDINSRDRFYMVSYGGDISNESFLKKYEKVRAAWKRGNEVGELPQATLLGFAVDFPIPVKVIEERPSFEPKAPVKTTVKKTTKKATAKAS